MSKLFLTPAQLQAEMDKCEFCQEKPCQTACPADCSPADFIMAAKNGQPADYKRAAALILGSNPLGGICGFTCPDYHCQKACVHRNFDRAVNIPAVQATIVQRARQLHQNPVFTPAQANGIRVAVIGAGPAGLAAAAVLAQYGCEVVVYEKAERAGGMGNYIPEHRLPSKTMQADIKQLGKMGKIAFNYNQPAPSPQDLRKQGFAAVVVATGLDTPIKLPVPGVEHTTDWLSFLQNPQLTPGQRVTVIGGGSIALDCALKAMECGARATLVSLEMVHELPLTDRERATLASQPIGLHTRTRLLSVTKQEGLLYPQVTGVELTAGKIFSPKNLVDVPGTEHGLAPCAKVVFAVGSRSSVGIANIAGVYYTGDMVCGPTTVVEAVAAGKNTAAAVWAYLNHTKKPKIKNPRKSTVVMPGRNLIPVSLKTDFFGRTINSPFLLSAAPPSDGLEQMRKAYEAGWAGGVMKTAFDGVDIHIPGRYMFVVNPQTYANCDNVSGHPLRRVCKEITQLVQEYPDRLTMASTGGPVTGDDESDKKVWQANTRLLEEAGVMGIEYSLSCPQGGDGTKGDIVSQDAELTAKIIGWVMEAGRAGVPKLFKLTGAVTSLYPILAAIKAVFEQYPEKKAGITLANTFPSMLFRPTTGQNWDEGVVVGLSGAGVIPISNLSLANAARFDLHISGNGGPMNYKAAADFLALGAKTVQFCTVVMKHGYGIINELHCGLSHLLQARGYRSVAELTGCALPKPITGFMELSPVKQISAVNSDLCQHCGNCTRCPYLAITLNSRQIPQTDAYRCIGCSVCVQKCFAGALYMRDRTPEEAVLLRED